MRTPVYLFAYALGHIRELATFVPVLQVLQCAMFHYYDLSHSQDVFAERTSRLSSVLCSKVKRHVLYPDDCSTASCMCVLWVKFGFKGNFYVEGHTAKIDLTKIADPNLKRSHVLQMANACSVTTVRYFMFHTHELVYRNFLVGHMSF